MKLLTQYGNKTIEFEVSYRNRKTLAIQTALPDSILVMFSMGIGKDFIKEKVKSKGKQIIKKILDFKDLGHTPIKRELVNGESFMYLG